MTVEYTLFEVFIREVWYGLIFVVPLALKLSPKFLHDREVLLTVYTFIVIVLYFWAAKTLLS
jgi:hypothetical protein